MLVRDREKFASTLNPTESPSLTTPLHPAPDTLATAGSTHPTPCQDDATEPLTQYLNPGGKTTNTETEEVEREEGGVPAAISRTTIPRKGVPGTATSYF